MMVLGLSSLLFCYALYRYRLLPRWMALWGLVGYALLGTGAVLEICGMTIGLLLSIPGGLFELVLGIWLLVRGFNGQKTDA